MNFIIKNIRDSKGGVFYDLLKHGVISGHDDDPTLRIAVTEAPFVRQPSIDMIMTEGIRAELIAAHSDLASSFHRIEEVEFYSVDPENPPEKLDRLVTRDDLDVVMWRKLEKTKLHPHEHVYLFTPPVIGRQIRESASDLTTSTLELPRVYKGEPYAQEKTICWSPVWARQQTCCWADGGYFIQSELFGLLADYLEDSDWTKFEVSEHGTFSLLA